MGSVWSMFAYFGTPKCSTVPRSVLLERDDGLHI
jgi:hypothetical protein